MKNYMNKLFETGKAVRNLNDGNVVIVPTDTVPGLAVDATNESAIERIYKIKKRDYNKTIPLLFPSVEQARKYLSISKEEMKLAEKFWPGGLTLVLKSKKVLPHILENPAGNIGARIPANETTRKLIKMLGKPIAATSINISGEPSITNLEQIPASITSQIAGILAGNYKSEGKPSTVVEVVKNEVKVYREGKVSIDEIREVLSNYTIVD